MLIHDYTLKKPEKGTPWKEKIITIENATDELLEVRVRYTSNPKAEITEHRFWEQTNVAFKFAPGEKA
jgi:hypothetical protein